MSQGIITLEALSCPSCLQKIEAAVKALNGVDADSLKVLFNSSKVKVKFDDQALEISDIEKAIEDMGYPVIKSVVKAA
ncbi:cation transporter [Aerococcaceae bacterium INB8]|uniref:Cation transporter n=1 Tax=Ruoffia halotolerans TaxID=2748684 RepID=A0A839A5G1_9LACT|nr:cation transporter [Ruoffia halotolerans]MBA5729232.1 cation transporter [Ruoffia halotolerans]